MLNFGQAARGFPGQRGIAQDHAHSAIGFIDRAIGLDRRFSLATREPSPRPVLPSSPVRVYILLSRLPMIQQLLKDATVAQGLLSWHSMAHSPELQAALDAAEKAALIARSLYQRNIEIRIKADKSPVTEADVRCEAAIREILEARFPAHGFYRRRNRMHRRDAEYLWMVDPIDGTKAFVREYPDVLHANCIDAQGEIVLGVSSAPIYGEVAYAERGQGAFLNGKPIAVSNIPPSNRRICPAAT